LYYHDHEECSLCRPNLSIPDVTWAIVHVTNFGDPLPFSKELSGIIEDLPVYAVGIHC
jgi:hypothetical protein